MTKSEPSMEEILARIRRIVAGDDVKTIEVAEVVGSTEQVMTPWQLPNDFNQVDGRLVAIINKFIRDRWNGGWVRITDVEIYGAAETIDPGWIVTSGDLWSTFRAYRAAGWKVHLVSSHPVVYHFGAPWS